MPTEMRRRPITRKNRLPMKKVLTLHGEAIDCLEYEREKIINEINYSLEESESLSRQIKRLEEDLAKYKARIQDKKDRIDKCEAKLVRLDASLALLEENDQEIIEEDNNENEENN